MNAYVILVDGCLSQEGYMTIQKAIEFIKNRADHPVQENTPETLWRYRSNTHIYLIKQINLFLTF